MRNFIIIAIVLFISIILFVLLLTKKAEITRQKKEGISDIDNVKVDQKLEKAINFLKSKFDKTFIFNDPYLRCIDQVKGCESNWRVLFLAQNVIYAKYEDELINKLPDIFQTIKTLEEIEYKKVKNKPLKNYPLEIYCNFLIGHIDNSNMKTQIINNYSTSLKGWISKTYYATPWQWRKIWDESYCTIALAEFPEENAKVLDTLNNHYNLYEYVSKKKDANIAKYQMAFVFEIIQLHNKRFVLEQKYIDFVIKYFKQVKDIFLQKTNNSYYYAKVILTMIKNSSIQFEQDLKSLIKECMLSIINAIDDEGKIPLYPIANSGSFNVNKYMSYATVNTLELLNLIFYFRKYLKNY